KRKILMNDTTQQVIEFLSYPELNFGSEEDILLLAEPQALQSRVASLLDQPHGFLSTPEADELKSRLHDADWPVVAQEFSTRVDMTARFFDADAEAAQQA